MFKQIKINKYIYINGGLKIQKAKGILFLKQICSLERCQNSNANKSDPSFLQKQHR